MKSMNRAESIQVNRVRLPAGGFSRRNRIIYFILAAKGIYVGITFAAHRN